MENIAKSTSYGCYLDCDFETAKYPDDKIHIVGLLAEYVYDLEQRILHYDERYIKLWNEIETLRECSSKEFDQDQKISDLEAKLAESELETARWQEHFEQARLDYDCLKEELAEKDKEIENLNNRILISQLQAPKEQMLNILGSQCVQYNPDQDKISFCIEQLEKVRTQFRNKYSWYEETHNVCEKTDDFIIWLDNQTKRLEEMK